VRGTYVESPAWDAAYSEEQQLVRLVAADRRMRGGGAPLSHVSAAALHELPLFRCRPDRVHVSGAQMNGNVETAGLIVARHRVAVADEDTTVIDGILCTALARTVADVLRSTRAETAIAVADAALRQVAWDERTRTYDEDAAEAFRTEVRRRIPAGGRGVKRARWMLEHADGRSQLPGEAVSRLYLLQLGYAPRIQVCVLGPNGEELSIDFALDAQQTFGEFDGKTKYVDPAMRAGRGIEQVLLAEKAREDWVRGVTGWRLVRWGMEHVATVETLGSRLRAFRVPPPSRGWRR
jgi:hypothetical protein